MEEAEVEQRSVPGDDRPYERPPHNFEFWIPALVMLLVVTAAAAYYFLQSHELPFTLPELGRTEPVAAQPTPPTAPAAAPAPAAEPPAEPAIRHPLANAEETEAEAEADAPAPSLPTLDNSDSMMRKSVAGLIGRKAFAERVIPDQLVRRIVTTVDTLPRQNAPRRMMPLQAVPGPFIASPGDEATIRPANFARYTPYVYVLESIDARALVQTYVRTYPLFQRAYRELGYPGKYFNDRLIEAIDDMLAAPELDGPIQLVRPKVLYEFADPDLQARSAGQKILMRMGKQNEVRVKVKLREIRGELLAASKARAQASR